MATLTGTSGNDFLDGTAASDTIDGLGGNDEMHGEGGAERGPSTSLAQGTRKLSHLSTLEFP
jgi:hypothetical protein